MLNFFDGHTNLAIVFFFIFTIIIGFVATILAKIAVVLRQKAHLSESVIGGILIGTITSIPELISSISSIIQTNINHADTYYNAINDTIGSNMFCFLILAIALIFYSKKFPKHEVNQTSSLTTVFVLIGGILILFACVFDNYDASVMNYNNNSPFVIHGFNIWTIFIFLSFVFSIIFMLHDQKLPTRYNVIKYGRQLNSLPISKNGTITKLHKMSKKTLINLFISISIALIISSYLLSDCATVIISSWKSIGNSNGVMRSILMGIATSIPELITVVAFAKQHEHELMIDSMVGSCSFNLSILVFSNIAFACTYTGQGSMFGLTANVTILLLLFLLQIMFMLLYLIFNTGSMKSNLTSKQSTLYNLFFLILSISAWFGCFIYALSN